MHVTREGADIVREAYLLGGTSALRDGPLQRCFRDIHAAGQHFMMSQTSYQALGQFKLDQPDANPML